MGSPVVPREQRKGADGGTAAGTAGYRPGFWQRIPLWPTVVALGITGAVLGYLAKWPCRFGGAWADGTQHRYGCYSDIFPLYYSFGLNEGNVPYIDHPVEYPVLTGAVMEAVRRAVAGIADVWSRGYAYFDLTALLLGVCLVIATVAVAYLAGRGSVEPDRGTGEEFNRPAALIAAAFVSLLPAAFMTAYINWDLLAVALTTTALVAYSRNRPWLAGVLLGLGVAAKLWPLFLLGPMFVLNARDRQWGRFLRVFGAAATAWVVVNAPVVLIAPEGWATFYRFSQERGADWGSIYYVLGEYGVADLSHDLVNLLGTGSFALACAAIAAFGYFLRSRPPLAQLLLLVVAAFLLTNKVWSPQFVLWLLPLAILARPRNLGIGIPVLVFTAWQLAEVGYILGIWWYLWHIGAPAGNFVGIGFDAYGSLALFRLSGLIMVCAMIVLDCWERGRATRAAVVT